ncbi:MAG TPA: DUF2760 domain-containing protein [Bryobacteraceae bacterium]|nr:DUF2760 domain-containing protein [Bryobacteraceae bacterium]
MERIIFAFRSFFAILFSGKLPSDIAKAYGYIENKPQPVVKPKPQAQPADGALQILSILQRDARLIDFLMEDISPYSDDQVGAAVRSLHDQCRETLDRYIHLTPVIDNVEGTFTKIDKSDPTTVKLLGNVPASGKAPGGLLRHKGWRVDRVDLPAITPGPQTTILAPAEIEIE